MIRCTSKHGTGSIFEILVDGMVLLVVRAILKAVWWCIFGLAAFDAGFHVAAVSLQSNWLVEWWEVL